MIAILDAGKTNKKVFIFNERYEVVEEHSTRLDEITDEDGDACENLQALTAWVRSSLDLLSSTANNQIKAINFTSYGASLVHLNEQGDPVLPLYNYLKPFPPPLLEKFFSTYGGQHEISKVTASPLLGHLNSGLLLYRLKHEKNLLDTGGYSLHLPQYLSFLVTGKPCSDITSIGCHTMLWNFTSGGYHRWVKEEGIIQRLAPIHPSDEVFDLSINGRTIKAGIGLHDSSAALIPYLACFSEPFVLISTGTWSITLNPFNSSPLTEDELQQDCLCYLSYQGKPVKASRLFAGHLHEEGVKRLNEYFNVQPDYYQLLRYDASLHTTVNEGFHENDLQRYDSFESAYHALVTDIVSRQVRSTNLVMSNEVTRLFVDGGFGKNEVYMKMLAAAYPLLKVYAASVPQATAMGAALAIHRHWNPLEVPHDVVELNHVVPSHSSEPRATTRP